MSTPAFSAPALEEMDELLPGFEFESQLSGNDTGAVYYARQKSLDRYVALKLFCPAKGNDERFLASLKRSASMVGNLRHPNLINFFDSGLVDGMPYLVMEFVPGKSLHRSTHGHTIEFKQSVAIIKEVCDGVAYAHENGVVHGNLSPLNILLNEKASPKIGNFALGRGIHTLPELEAPSHFSAPEVLQGEAHTEASDVYSMGAMLYELITATPYRPGAPRASELEGSPLAVDKVIEKACATDPGERHAGAAKFQNALNQASSSKLKSASSPAKPGAAGAPARNKAVAMAMDTSGTGIVLKVVVIIVLLIAINQVWNYRKAVTERRQQLAEGAGQSGDAEITSFEMVKRQRQQQAQQRQQQAAPPPEVVEIPDEPETPMESLERLRGSLTSGNFSELPIGTISQGGHHYFLVDEAMTWNEAVTHAQELGGYVALPDGKPDWNGHEPIQGRTVWVGAARSGASAFTQLDGSAWQPATSVGGTATYLHLDEGGRFTTAAAATRFPYVIQWAEGTTPKTFEMRLAATASSIRSGQAVYPPGTLAVGQRHYLPVLQPTSWQEASKLAQAAGGNLMVLSNDEESAEIDEWSSQLAAGSDYWLGGRLEGERWEWVTGEPWRAIEWTSVSNAATDGAAMVLSAGRGLDATGKSGRADGFIIEWSTDAQTNKPDSNLPTTPLESPGELTDMASKLVTQAIADKEAAHTKNTEKLAWDLKAHLRGLNKSSQDLWSPEADKLKTCVQNNRLSKEAIDNSGAKLSPFMAKLCNYLLRKQDDIDEQHAKSLKVIHEHYLKKLAEIRDQAKARGQVKAQVAAEELINDSQNLDSWVAKMSVAQP